MKQVKSKWYPIKPFNVFLNLCTFPYWLVVLILNRKLPHKDTSHLPTEWKLLWSRAPGSTLQPPHLHSLKLEIFCLMSIDWMVQIGISLVLMREHQARPQMDFSSFRREDVKPYFVGRPTEIRHVVHNDESDSALIGAPYCFNKVITTVRILFC